MIRSPAIDIAYRRPSQASRSELRESPAMAAGARAWAACTTLSATAVHCLHRVHLTASERLTGGDGELNGGILLSSRTQCTPNQRSSVLAMLASLGGNAATHLIHKWASVSSRDAGGRDAPIMLATEKDRCSSLKTGVLASAQNAFESRACPDRLPRSTASTSLLADTAMLEAAARSSGRASLGMT